MMQLVEQHIVKDSSFMDVCIKAKNIYNQSLYYWRQSIFGNIKYFSEFELTTLFAEFNEENYRALPAQTSQQVIKLLFKNIKSWQKSRKEYKKYPVKFLGRPKLPKYKKETSICIFTNQQIKIIDGYIHFPKLANLKPLRTKQNNVQQVRIIPHINHCVVEIVYNVKEAEKKDYNGKWIGVDLGLNNLATIASNEQSFIVNGKPLKSINHYYNKRKKSLQSKLVQDVYSSKRIEKITHVRNNKVKDYLHKASKIIIDNAVKQDITKIIIGKNENWKQNINIGKKNNRQFSSIPHATLIEMIQYKAQLVGIETVLTQESYTSKCSALDLEPICKHEKYVGKRKNRGLFVTATGKLINADANGALNIARLGLSATGNEFKISDSVLSCVSHPKKLSVLLAKHGYLNKFNLI
ncbi:MAG: transposase [Saprospiraceae bacterium]